MLHIVKGRIANLYRAGDLDRYRKYHQSVKEENDNEKTACFYAGSGHVSVSGRLWRRQD